MFDLSVLCCAVLCCEYMYVYIHIYIYVCVCVCVCVCVVLSVVIIVLLLIVNYSTVFWFASKLPLLQPLKFMAINSYLQAKLPLLTAQAFNRFTQSVYCVKEQLLGV